MYDLDVGLIVLYHELYRLDIVCDIVSLRYLSSAVPMLDEVVRVEADPLFFKLILFASDGACFRRCSAAKRNVFSVDTLRPLCFVTRRCSESWISTVN